LLNFNWDKMKKIFLLIYLLIVVKIACPQPTLPIVIYPLSDSCICPFNVHFIWHHSSGATSYRIQIWMGTNIVLDASGIQDTIYNVPDSILFNNTFYYWRLNASGPSGTSSWTSLLHLCLIQTANPPFLISPPNGVVNISIHPMLDWTDVQGANSYILQISLSPTFDSLVVNDTTPLAGIITLQYNKTYYWRVCATNSNCRTNWSSVWHFTTISSSIITRISSEIPSEYKLYNNYPNPFNPYTIIKYQIKAEGSSQNPEVRIMIYDVLGKEIETLVNEKQSPGTYEVKFDGSNLPNGIYFYTIRSGDFVDTKRMVLIK
jgi:hypothetical protein